MKSLSFSNVKKGKQKNIDVGKYLFFKRIPFAKIFYLSVLINLISIIFVLIIKKSLPPELPLFYGLPEGEEQLSNTTGLITVPLVSLGIVLVNLLLTFFVKNDFLKKSLIVTGLGISILSVITTFQIILLIGGL